MARFDHWATDPVSQRAQRYRSPRLAAAAQRVARNGELRALLQAERMGVGAWERLPPADAFADGRYLVGHQPDGQPVVLSDADINGPLTLLVGPPNSGKTYLMERWMAAADAGGIPVIGVDTKNGPGVQPLHPLPVLEPGEAALSMEPPQGSDARAFLNRLLTLIEQTLYLHSGSGHILEAWQRLLERTPVGDAVCLRQILHDLEERAGQIRSFSKAAQHLESAVVALRRLCGSHDLFSAVRGLSWAHRFVHSHVLRMRGLPAEAVRIGAMLYCEAFLRHAEAAGWQHRQLRTLFAFDDARVLARSLGRDGHAAVDALLNFMDLAHAGGGGVLLAVQHLGEVSADLVAAANALLLIGPTSAEDVRQLRSRLQLTPAREVYLLQQPAYHAVVHLRNHAWPLPVPVCLAGPAYAMDAQEAAKQRVVRKRALFAGVDVKLWKHQEEPPIVAAPRPRPKPPAPGPNVVPVERQPLPAEQHRLLVALLDRPWLLQTELGARCGVEGRLITALRDELAQTGLVVVHRFARYTLWEATAAAASRIGRVFEPLAGRGAFPHRFLQRRWAAWMQRACPRVAIVHEIPGVGPVDGYAEREDGTRVAVEIVLSPETLERSVAKLGRVHGERMVVVLDKTAAKAAQTALTDLLGVEVVTVQEFVKLTAQSQPL